MEFQEITREEYQNFWENHPQKTFLSAPEITDLRKDEGWDSYFVGVKDKKKIMAASMLFSHKRHFGKYEFYSPRGFLCDYDNCAGFYDLRTLPVCYRRKYGRKPSFRYLSIR